MLAAGRKPSGLRHRTACAVPLTRPLIVLRCLSSPRPLLKSCCHLRPQADASQRRTREAAGHLLPVGTYLHIVDLDTIEHLTLRAYDAQHQAVSTPWINCNPLEQHGSGTGVGFPGSLLPTDMPGSMI